MYVPETATRCLSVPLTQPDRHYPYEVKPLGYDEKQIVMNGQNGSKF